MIANLPVLQILIYGVQPQPKPSYQSTTQDSAPQLVKPNGYTPDMTRNGRCMENSNYKVPGSFADGDNEDDDEDDDGYEDAAEDGAVISPDVEEKDEYEGSSKSGRSSSIALSGQRTVSIRNLPDRVTHENVTDAVRGGALLHVYLRPRDHFADVSFVDESAAHDFLQYSRTYGLYVAGKRVSCCNLVYETYNTNIVSRQKLHGVTVNSFCLPMLGPKSTGELLESSSSTT